jgi:hypothetical protein
MAFDFKENVTMELPNVSDEVRKLTEAQNVKRNKILTEIAAIHAGLTSNFNMYTEEALTNSVGTWVDPYPKPIIINHDEFSDPMGRVMAAKMAKEADGTPYVAIQAMISSPEAIERVLDQRYMTGSVGGRAGSAKCSICGTDWAKESNGAMPCRHKRGKVYEGKLAYFELGDITWREYSFVNIPADKYSQLKAVLDDGKGNTESEGEWLHPVKVFSLDMDEESILSLSENEEPTNILKALKKTEAAFTYHNVKGTFLTTIAYDLLENEENLNDELEKEYEEKFKFIQNDTTIESETVDNIDSIASKEKNAMTNHDETVQEENDILSVAEGLRADAVSEDSEVSAQEDSDEKVDEEELVDGSTEETDSDSSSETVEGSVEDSETEAKEEEASETDANEDQPLVESGEEPEVVDDQNDLNEQTEESSDEVIETSDQPEELQSEAAKYEEEIQALKEENAKLKQHLHFMLAERVVDAKISVGYIPVDNRKEAILEHEKRTASSLADALKDLQTLSNVQSTVTETPNAKDLLDVRSQAVEGEDSVLTDDIEADEQVATSVEDQLIERFTQVLIGRNKL